MTTYKAGDKVYIIESNRMHDCPWPQRFVYNQICQWRGIQIEVQRLFGSEEETETNLPKPKNRSKQKNTASV